MASSVLCFKGKTLPMIAVFAPLLVFSTFLGFEFSIIFFYTSTVLIVSTVIFTFSKGKSFSVGKSSGRQQSSSSLRQEDVFSQPGSETSTEKKEADAALHSYTSSANKEVQVEQNETSFESKEAYDEQDEISLEFKKAHDEQDEIPAANKGACDEQDKASAEKKESSAQKKQAKEWERDIHECSARSSHSLSESEGINQTSTSEDSEIEYWTFQDNLNTLSLDSSDGSISDEDSLIEIALPSGQCQHINNQDHYMLQKPSTLMELFAEMNEEDNMIEIDISMGSIKYPRFEIEA